MSATGVGDGGWGMGDGCRVFGYAYGYWWWVWAGGDGFVCMLGDICGGCVSDMASVCVWTCVACLHVMSHCFHC